MKLQSSNGALNCNCLCSAPSGGSQFSTQSSPSGFQFSTPSPPLSSFTPPFVFGPGGFQSPQSQPPTSSASTCIAGATPPHSSCLPNSSDYISTVIITPLDEQAIINRHNYWRGQLNPPAVVPERNLTWNSDLAKTAERWAAQCKASHDTSQNRNDPGTYSYVGQNICVASYDQPWTDCIDSWAGERAQWQYGLGPTSTGADVGHYTQIIWADTQQVGCGKAYCQGSWAYQLVCNYGPGGNIKTPQVLNWWSNPYTATTLRRK